MYKGKSRFQQKDEVYGLSVDRTEIDRSAEASQDAKRYCQIVHAGVRDRHTAPNPSRVELLAFQNVVRDALRIQFEGFRCASAKVRQQARLVGCANVGDRLMG
jgi:hypothetical protein